MHPRASSRLVAGLLVAAGIIGGVVVFTAQRRAGIAVEVGGDVSGRLDEMILAVSEVAAAQQASVAPGQADQPWLDRSSTLLGEFSGNVAALRPRLRSADATRLIDDIDRAWQALTAVDAKAQEDISQGQSVLAADRIFNEGRDALTTLASAVRTLRTAEVAATTSQLAGAERDQWLALGVIALVWMSGLAVLVRIVAHDVLAVPPVTTAHPAPVSAPENVRQAPVAACAVPDLAAAADVCTSIARISDAAALPDILARTATLLDARGVVVWMGAGDELFPVLASGYDDRLLRRLGPISRTADNATADAWRSGRMRTVTTDVATHGAIAAPMTGIAGCVGVLAAEVRRGRETDGATQAVAMMIAAQLAGVVSAWPSASATAADGPASIAF